MGWGLPHCHCDAHTPKRVPSYFLGDPSQTWNSPVSCAGSCCCFPKPVQVSNRSRGPPVVSVLPSALGMAFTATLGLQTIYNHGPNCHFCNEISPRYAFEYHHP